MVKKILLDCHPDLSDDHFSYSALIFYSASGAFSGGTTRVIFLEIGKQRKEEKGN